MEPLLESNDDIHTYLHRQERKELLRFVTVGSVDDGKSTLIGRLLHDTNGIYDDQLSAVKKASSMAGTEIDFSLFTDGLKAEREQGITIDVAYRYFATEARKFIIADTPGHVQYTRNMATGASTASLAIILIDARLGVLQQSRRHAYIASLLGIPHLVVCVNKIDLRGYDPKVYDAIREEFAAFAANLDFKNVTYIPMSALKGDNVVHRSDKTPFYDGPTLLEHLERVPVGAELNLTDFRYPVQLVLRPSHDYRGYAGQIASGVVRVGDPILVLPSRKTTRVAAIDAAGRSLDEAFAPMSVTLRLADEIDVSRGDMLVHPTNVPRATQRFDATMVWLHERPLDREKSYLLKHTTQTVRAEIEDVDFVLDLESLEKVKASGLALNDIGRVSVRAHRPLFVDAYRDNRNTGAFILIDSLTNDTVAAGMILAPDGLGAHAAATQASARDGAVITGVATGVSARERRERLGHAGFALVLRGAPRDGRDPVRAVAFATERLLFDRGVLATVVDGASPHGLASAAACVDAGVVVVYVAPAEGDALADRIGNDRIVTAVFDGADAERAAAAVVADADARGLFTAR